MSARALVGGVILAGAGYVILTQRAQAQQQPEYIVQPASHRPARQQNDYTPLIGWGLEAVMNWTKSNNSGAKRSNPLAGLFGGRSTTTATATPRGASAGAQTGFSVPALQQMIRSKEAPEGYDQVYGGSRIQPPRPITTMTVDEVLDWQSRSVAAGSPSSAAGGYQIIRPTLRDLKRDGHVRGSDTFDAATQDRLSRVLMERRGLSDFEAGRISATKFGNNLAKEWASLPVLTGRKRGRSYYAGDGLNKALISVDQVLARLGGY